MQLYPLLKDRASINILKILYDNEVSENKYAMQYAELKSLLSVPERPETIENLKNAGLAASEENEQGELVLSITQKGKDFIELFDKLVAVMQGKKEEQKAYKVEYDLAVLEQRILVLCLKMKSEAGCLVGLRDLTQEVYPYKDAAKMSGTVSRYAKRLEELNLLIRIKQGKDSFFDVTESGERVVQEKLEEAPVPAV